MICSLISADRIWISFPIQTSRVIPSQCQCLFSLLDLFRTMLTITSQWTQKVFKVFIPFINYLQHAWKRLSLEDKEFLSFALSVEVGWRPFTSVWPWHWLEPGKWRMPTCNQSQAQPTAWPLNARGNIAVAGSYTWFSLPMNYEEVFHAAVLIQSTYWCHLWIPPVEVQELLV